MTVAPRMPVASSTLSIPSKLGTKPAATSRPSSPVTAVLKTKPSAMTASSPAIASSNGR